MKRIKMALLCAAGAAAPAAQAQSPVTFTLSGILDVAAREVHNEGVGARKSLVNGSNATSRLIIAGRSDLNADLYAQFHLEQGLLVDTGEQATKDKLFDRRATLSLASKSYGELRMGRDYVPTYSNWSRYDPFSYVGVARSANLMSATATGPIRAAFGVVTSGTTTTANPNTTVRSDNAVQWLAPSGWNGFEGGVMVAAPEAGDVALGQAKLLGLRVGYDAKVWSVSAATARSTTSLTTAGDFEDTAIGGTWQLAPVRLSTAWREFKYATARQSVLMLGAVAVVGPHEFKASWVTADLQGRVGTTVIDGNDASQIGLGYVFNFNDKSAVYGSVSQISNDGASRLVLSDGVSGMAAGGTSKGFEVGFRHRF